MSDIVQEPIVVVSDPSQVKVKLFNRWSFDDVQKPLENLRYMIIDKIVEGCLRKYIEDFVVMDQKFVMNDTMKVKNIERAIVDSGLIYSFKF
ncbi:hypothetical protein QL285_076903 [Trifolium repens]|nr:hypothetical protein QL285_076903 [Trifolium repens]